MDKRRGKKFAKIRVALLDHMPTLARNTDAALLYLYGHLETPLSGPTEGCFFVSQKAMAECLGWDRKRLRRAIRWLENPPGEVGHPYIVAVRRSQGGRTGQGTLYYLWNHDGEQRRKSATRADLGGVVEPHPSTPLGGALHGADMPTQTRWVGRSMGQSDPPTVYKERARLKEPETKRESERGADAMESEDQDPMAEGESLTEETMLLFKTEEDMRRYFEGYFADLPDEWIAQAVEVAMESPQRYNVGLLQEDPEDLWEGDL